MLIHGGCPERFSMEKSEHMMFDDRSTFSYDFQGPTGTEHDAFCEHLMSTKTLRWSDNVLGIEIMTLGHILGSLLALVRISRSPEAE